MADCSVIMLPTAAAHPVQNPPRVIGTRPKVVPRHRLISLRAARARQARLPLINGGDDENTAYWRAEERAATERNLRAITVAAMDAWESGTLTAAELVALPPDARAFMDGYIGARTRRTS